MVPLNIERTFAKHLSVDYFLFCFEKHLIAKLLFSKKNTHGVTLMSSNFDIYSYRKLISLAIIALS